MPRPPEKKAPATPREGEAGADEKVKTNVENNSVPSRRRRLLTNSARREVRIPGFPVIRLATATELREGLDEDIERTCWRAEPVDRVDMMSFADRLSSLVEQEEAEGIE
jgi:hypothetical protein